MLNSKNARRGFGLASFAAVVATAGIASANPTGDINTVSTNGDKSPITSGVGSTSSAASGVTISPQNNVKIDPNTASSAAITAPQTNKLLTGDIGSKSSAALQSKIGVNSKNSQSVIPTLTGGNNTTNTSFDYSTPATQTLLQFGNAWTSKIDVPAGSSGCGSIFFSNGADGTNVNFAGWLSFGNNHTVIADEAKPLAQQATTCASLQNAQTAASFSRVEEDDLASAIAGADTETAFKLILARVAKNANPSELRNLLSLKKSVGTEEAVNQYLIGLATKNSVRTFGSLNAPSLPEIK